MRRDWITRRGRTLAAALGAILALASSASALVLVQDSEEQQLRANIQRQQHKYVRCLVAAARKCEKGGALVGPECDLNTSTAAPPADGKGKFAAAVTKCDSKLDYEKNLVTLTSATGYTAIGCPGDMDNTTPLDPDVPFANLAAWQAAAPAATKSQIQILAVAMGALSGCNTQPDLASQQLCQITEVRRIANYAFAVQKCERRCETDYLNMNGNGGTTDAPNCNLVPAGNAGGGDPNFNNCVAKAFTKAEKNSPFPPNVAALVLPALATALNDANHDINNEDDCP